MGLPLRPKTFFTPTEYYGQEHGAAHKSDYYRGEIYDMAGGTSTHSLITNNINGEIRNRLKGRPCRMYESNMRLAIEATGLRTYPDGSIYCQPIEYDPVDPALTTATNPTVLFEVLSPSTERYDRGAKADNYRLIPSLVAYVLVAQDEPHVELFERGADGAWHRSEATGLDASIRIPAANIDLPLAEVYDGIDFPPASAPR